MGMGPFSFLLSSPVNLAGKHHPGKHPGKGKATPTPTSTGATASGTKGKVWRNQQQQGNVANLPWRLVWEGYDWVKGFETLDKQGKMPNLYVPRVIAHAQKKVLDNHLKDIEWSCVYKTLLALSNDLHQILYLDEKDWSKPVGVQQFYDIATVWSKLGSPRIKLVIWGILTNPADGFAVLKREGIVNACATEARNTVFVPNAQGEILHYLPIFAPNENIFHEDPGWKLAQQVPLAAPAVVDAASSTAPSPTPAAPGPDPVAPAGGTVQTVPTAVAIAAAAVVTLATAASDAAATPATPPAPAPVPPAPVPVPPAALPVPPPGPPGPAFGPPTPFVAPLAWAPCTYQGVYPPSMTSSVIPLDWLGGWWASQAPRECSFGDSLMLALVPPDFASATLDMAEKYLDRVDYFPPTGLTPSAVNSEGVWECRPGHITDGCEMVQYFRAGDVIRTKRASFVAAPVVDKYGNNVLRLRAARESLLSVVERWARKLPLNLVDQCESVQLEHHQYAIPTQVSQTKAHWMAQLHTASDPLVIKGLQRMRQDEAAAGWPGNDEPEGAAIFLQNMAKTYPKAVDIAGSFTWGYCYSCGVNLPGKFVARLCAECNKRMNTPLGRLVAEGAKICSLAKPVAYPGVVNTQTRHPPLKPGTLTLATPANFGQAPHLQHKSVQAPLLSALARALVVSE